MPEPPRAPRLLDQLRQHISYLHYSLRTEQCCVQWVPRFIWRLDAICLMAIERVAEGESPAAAMEPYGFNRTSIYKWIDKAL